MKTNPILSDDRYETLLDATRDDPVLYTYTLLLGDVGLRPAEVVGLRWEDIDLEERVGWARTGKGGPHEFPLSGRLATALVEHRASLAQSSPHVFPGTSRGGRKGVIPRIERGLRAAAVAAGSLRPFTWVALRRRCFLRWTGIGHPDHVIRRAMGYVADRRKRVTKQDLHGLVDVWDPSEE